MVVGYSVIRLFLGYILTALFVVLRIYLFTQEAYTKKKLQSGYALHEEQVRAHTQHNYEQNTKLHSDSNNKNTLTHKESYGQNAWIRPSFL